MTRAVDETTHVDELRLLEAEAVHIIGEVVDETADAAQGDQVLDTAGANTEELAAQVIAQLDKRSPRPLPR